MTSGDLLGDRYTIERELGRGGAGITFLVRDTRDDSSAVAKLLHLDLLRDWKAVELFEREAAVLKGLHHDCIPAYKDFFRADVEGSARFVLVRQFVDGKSLQEKVDTGWRATEEEICDIGARLLNVVDYIHSVRPPVIHRDINPRNVIQRADAAVFLLDFGGVQDAIRISGVDKLHHHRDSGLYTLGTVHRPGNNPLGPVRRGGHTSLPADAQKPGGPSHPRHEDRFPLRGGDLLPWAEAGARELAGAGRGAAHAPGGRRGRAPEGKRPSRGRHPGFLPGGPLRIPHQAPRE